MQGNSFSLGLDGKWQLRFGQQNKSAPCTPEDLNESDWPVIDAEVPGNVELDLIRAGYLPEDLDRGNNIYELRKYETCRWWYFRRFSSPGFDAGQRVFLVFEGLDCLAKIWINGHEIGSTENMLIAHRFDVTDVLHRREGGRENEIYVRIDSPVLDARERQIYPGEYAAAGSRREGLNVRKAPHMFGWDISPRIVSAGLWRSVRLDILNPTRWRDVYWVTKDVDIVNSTATIFLDYDFKTNLQDIDRLRVRVSVKRDNQSIFQKIFPVIYTHDLKVIELKDVEFWWPNGYGEAALYDAVLELLDEDDSILDVSQTRIGIRTVELQRTDTTSEKGDGEFVFIVNGERIFARGTNWVPLDAIHSRDVLHVRKTFDMMLDLHCNMVRCWGGNVYEDTEFFDLCDANGIMVWQDFAMACLIYPQTPEFAEKIRKEATEVVRKFRNHPALVLWAGNNEIDESYKWAGFGIDPNTDTISRDVLSAVIRQQDPSRARDYLPSSPYHSPELVRRGNSDRLKPEDHLWGPRDDAKSSFYTLSPAHFVSEIGFHGCPCRASLEDMLDAEYLWPWQDNEQWLTKSVRPLPAVDVYNYRIPLMAKQIKVVFGSVPENLDDYILASQITQAEALKFLIEHWRASKWRGTGLLWWNLRDGWPMISDAIVDYYYRKKLAYEYVKRSQTPVCLICREDVDGRVNLIAVNDTRTSCSGEVLVRDIDGSEPVIHSDFFIDSNSRVGLTRLPAVDSPKMWVISWTLDNGETGKNHYLAGPRPYDFREYLSWLKHPDMHSHIFQNGMG